MHKRRSITEPFVHGSLLDRWARSACPAQQPLRARRPLRLAPPAPLRTLRWFRNRV